MRAARERPRLETEHEHDLEAAGACAHQVEHGHTTRFARRREPHFAALECADHLVAGDVEPAELRQQLEHVPVRAQIEPRAFAGRRSFGSIGRALVRSCTRIVPRRIVGGEPASGTAPAASSTRAGVDRPPRRRPLDVVDGRASPE